MANFYNDLTQSINCLALHVQEDSSLPQDSNPSYSIQDYQANAAMTNQTA